GTGPRAKPCRARRIDPAELFAPIGNAPGGVGPDGKPIGGPGVGPGGKPGGDGGAGGKPPAPPPPRQRPAGGAKAPKPDRLAPNLRNIPALQEKLEVEHRGITSDNSNTQFAVLALWAAQRHGVPMERCLALLVKRFHQSQNPDGGWGY